MLHTQSIIAYERHLLVRNFIPSFMTDDQCVRKKRLRCISKGLKKCFLLTDSVSKFNYQPSMK